MVFLYLFFVFITVVSFCWLFYLLLFETKDQIKQRLKEQGTKTTTAYFKEKMGRPVLGNQLSQFFSTTSYYKNQKKLLSKAYVHMKPEELMKTSLLLGSTFALGGWIVQKNTLVAVLVFFVGILLPRLILTVISAKRSKQMNAQLPHALTLISNGLRAGFSFNQALGIVSEEMEAPIGEEFGKIMHDSQLGKPIDEALADFRERTDDEDISIVVTTLLTQLQVGGDLAEILEIIASTIRERAELRGQIKTLTSQSKFSAVVMGVLPIGLAGFIYVINPDYIEVMFKEPLGLVMLGTAVSMSFIGIIVLYKIVNIKI